MPVSRKYGSTRSSVGRSSHDESARARSQSAAAVSCDETGADSRGAAVPIPVHPLFPELPPPQGELFFECTLFLYSVLAMFLQYLNLYKTMWWLPNSYTHYALKFHLIDLYLLSCVGLILGRRVTWCFLKKLTVAPFAAASPDSPLPKYVIVIEWILKLPAIGAIVSSFSFSSVQVLYSYPLASLLYIFYPCLFFIFLFYNDIVGINYHNHHYRLATSSSSNHQQGDSGGDKNNQNQPVRLSWRLLALMGGNFIDHKTQHACSLKSANIREEAEILMCDLYQRGKHTLYAAFTTSYFAVFIPSAFAPAGMYVDYWWKMEVGAIVFFTSASLYLAHLLPLQYCNLLEKAVAHLGYWQKMEKLPHGLPFQLWSDNELWTEGSVVKYGRCLYRGQGTCIAAEPGNIDHERIYMLMRDPLRLVNYLCLLQAGLILVQFVLLVHSTDWQHIVTLVLLMFANYVMLFKLFKDKVILGRIYNPPRDDDNQRRR